MVFRRFCCLRLGFGLVYCPIRVVRRRVDCTVSLAVASHMTLSLTGLPFHGVKRDQVRRARFGFYILERNIVSMRAEELIGSYTMPAKWILNVGIGVGQALGPKRCL